MTLTRRHILTAAMGLGAATSLVACGRNSPGAGPATPEAAATPRPGGTLRVGALGTAKSLTKDPHGLLSNNSDFLIMSLIHDALTVPGAYATAERPQTVAPRLATSWEVAADARTWTFTLAERAVFHDGTPVTAADVVYSLRRIITDKQGAFKVPVPPDQINAVGDRQVRLVTAEPNSQLPLLLRLVTFTVKQNSSADDFVGCGPFRMDRYRDGNARLVRHEGWHGPRPMLEAIEVTRFETAESMANALRSGQIDLATAAGPITARTVEGDPRFRVSRRANDTAMPIIMRTSDGPFADARVREAVKLSVDRPQLVRNVLSGYGSVANDIMGAGDQFYARDIPQRTRDLTRARELLRAAGYDTSQRHQLFTPNEAFGQVDAARLFAQQVAEAGVLVDVVEQDGGTFYDTSWCKAPLTAMVWGTNDSLAFYAQKVMASWSKTNESGWHNGEFDAAYRRLLAATSADEQRAASLSLQQIQHADSGYLLWGMADGVDVHTRSVHNLPTGPGFAWALMDQVWMG